MLPQRLCAVTDIHVEPELGCTLAIQVVKACDILLLVPFLLLLLLQSVYAIVHNAPHRQLAQPNSGIAAEDAARAHHSLGLYS